MEVETVEMVDTSRLFKILVSEREEEELEKSERMESAFRNIKKTLSKKFSFKKLKTASEKANNAHETNFSTKIIQQLNNSIRNGFTKKKLKNFVTNSVKDDLEDDLASCRDSAYFSQSCYRSENEAIEEVDTTNNIFDITTTLSRSSSFSTSPILTTNSSTHKTPKKSVTIILPQTRTKEMPFGLHLRIEKVYISYEDATCDYGDISLQVKNIQYLARCTLVEHFPSMTNTINHLFSVIPSSLLLSLSCTIIGDLMFQLRILLFSPLLPLVHLLDVVLFVIIRFLHQVSFIVQSVENCEYFNQRMVELSEKCKKCFYGQQVECLADIRAVYVDLWCSMVIA